MQSATAVSEEVREKLSKIETVMGEDPGNRGIGPLVEVSRGGLLNAALQLRSAQSVGIVSGFFIIGCSAPETDGPLGALAIARALTGLNKRVTIITDEWSQKVMKAAYDVAYPIETKEGNSSFVVYPTGEEDASGWAKRIIHTYKFDHLLSIERVGPAADGKCYNMRGMDITPYTAPLHTLFEEADRQNIHTTGIGDGGNEIGMGKVVELVRQCVPHGDKIGCSTATENLLVTGVSNWGGYALATSIYTLERQGNSLATGLLPTREKESHLLDVIVEAGAVDGPLRIPARSVDGIPFDKYIEQLERMIAIASADLFINTLAGI